MRRPLLIATLGLALALASCTSDEPGTDPTAEPTTVPTSPEPTSSTPSSPATDPPSATPEPEPSAIALAEVTLAYEVWAEGFAAPVLALPRPGTDDVWVVEQGGRIVAVAPGGDQAEVADLSDLVDAGGERGLLGLAFAPDHEATGDFVVHYSATATGGDTRIERWSVDGDGAERGSIVLEVEQPAGNHNGGMIQFGPDGMLYIALGDGGAANDRFGNGQRADTLLGTMLRLDLAEEPYAIPSDNPFVGGSTPDGAAAAPEVWAYGLRNPWRTWIDGEVLYIGDVGQGQIEEVDVIGLDQAGVNFGWPILEGTRCFQQSGCSADGTVLPVTEYDHSGGACSITGGVVGDGPAAPDVAGVYFYSDFCAGFLRAIRVEDGAVVDERDFTDQVGVPSQVLSFGLDQEGNVLVLTLDGSIRRIVQPA